jgi:hypothetical protein
MGFLDTIRRLTGRRPSPKADLLPVLRTYAPNDPFAEAVVNRPVGPDLGIFLAHVNWTPRQTLGIDYLMRHAVEPSGGPDDGYFEAAYANLRRGLKVEGGEVDGATVFQVRHALDHGTSALGLPDFYTNATAWAGTGNLFVGFTDPSTLFITAMENADVIRRFRDAVLKSDYWGSVSLTPACYQLNANGLRLIEARAEKEGRPSSGG